MILFAAFIAFLTPATAGQPVLHEERDPSLEFTYGWDSVVEEEPALRAMLEQERNAARAQAREWAAEDREARGPNAPFHPHSYSKVWHVEGAAPPLLSLTAMTQTYTGGAHGGLALSALLWDRAADRQVDTDELLDAEAMARVEPRFCDALDAMRTERRGDPVRRDPDDSFTACLPLAEQALAPADKDGNGRFDTLQVLIPPYAAGPWVEGPYFVELPFQAEDLAGLPQAYRASFEEGRPELLSPPEGERG